MKRAFDLIVSFLALILLFPIMAIIGLAITLNDGGPVFFKQTRIGRYGDPFKIFKFRSMSVLKDAENGIFEPGKTQRITTVGKVLRKMKLDELPQLFNVFKGEMSLVGPRPEIAKWVKCYPERWKTILMIKPGMTDNASLAYINEEILLRESDSPESLYRDFILPSKLDLYEQYVFNQTFIGDILIIIKTIRHIIMK